MMTTSAYISVANSKGSAVTYDWLSLVNRLQNDEPLVT